MRRWFTFLAILLLGFILLAGSFDFQVMADVGNFNDYDSGGTDWGDSGWNDSGSDWDSGSGSSGGSVGFSLPVVVIVIIFIAFKAAKKNARGNVGGTPGGSYSYVPNLAPADMTQSIETQIKTADPDFSSQKFLSWSEEVFMTLQDAWTKREWKMIRPFECETLFNKHSRQLEEYIRNNTINVVERVCVNRSVLSNYSTDNQYEYLTVYMMTRMNDYIIDATTKQVVKGDKDREFHTNYYLKFMRSLGVKTSVNSGKSTTNCPNCGAPTQITSAGECEYCNSVITTGNHDWVLCDLDSAQ